MSSDFDTAYREHFAEIRRFVFHLVQDAALADELTQDSFLKALQAWGRYRHEAPERIWLFRIARNVCFDYLRSPRSRARNVVSLEITEAEGRETTEQSLATAANERPLSVEQVAQQAEMTECVRDFVLTLPETIRVPLILHDMHGMTNVEIAQVLGCSLEAAKMRLHRGRVQLRKMMEERCDLFHDERNVLSCLPAPPETGFVAVDEIGTSRPPQSQTSRP